MKICARKFFRPDLIALGCVTRVTFPSPHKAMSLGRTAVGCKYFTCVAHCVSRVYFFVADGGEE